MFMFFKVFLPCLAFPHMEKIVEMSIDEVRRAGRNFIMSMGIVSKPNVLVLTVIGRGSYAKVVQAEHKKTKQIYAIKIIKKQMFNEDEDIDWVQTEKSVFEAASNHPFLVGLHSCFQTDSHHARFYSAEIILALHFLHSRGIIYRDLKLDNVLIDTDGHIKLTDYGMGKENIGPGDVTSTFCGTPNYIAPEILRGDDYGFSVDWWALGVLMFEMMAGRSPFDFVSPTGDQDMNTEGCPFPDDSREADSNSTQFVGESFPSFERIPQQGANRTAWLLSRFKPGSSRHARTYILQNIYRLEMYLHPYNPNVTGMRDLQHFDQQFTEENPNLTVDDPSVIARIDQSEFDGFDYVKSS
ncbi:unnamed protein product, partial [Mesorhabditis belari]|uniref:Protein kinase domain-containing protein n=1 Tax=Mesorhabditis belari TaxID=2138241 RepID=A0AAF3ESA3_9BILA